MAWLECCSDDWLQCQGKTQQEPLMLPTLWVLVSESLGSLFLQTGQPRDLYSIRRETLFPKMHCTEDIWSDPVTCSASACCQGHPNQMRTLLFIFASLEVISLLPPGLPCSQYHNLWGLEYRGDLSSTWEFWDQKVSGIEETYWCGRASHHAVRN